MIESKNNHRENLIEVFDYWTSRFPHKIVYGFIRNEHSHVVISYDYLQQRVRTIAAHLENTCQPGARVLLLFETSLEFTMAFLGCLAAGVIAVPCQIPRASRSLDTLSTIIDDTGGTLILTTRHLLARLPGDVCSEHKISWWAVEDLEAAASRCRQRPTGDDIAFIQYTSGSTSQPKGVMVSHGNLLANLEMIADGFEFDADMVMVTWLPQYHDMGLIGMMLAPLFVGGSCYMMPPQAFIQRPPVWLQAVSRFRATVTGGPNFAFDHCLARVRPEHYQGLDLSCLKVLFCGSEPIRSRTMTGFLEKFSALGLCPQALYPCYGMAEVTLFATGVAVREPIGIAAFSKTPLESGIVAPFEEAVCDGNTSVQHLVACGYPRNNAIVEIVSPQSGRVCAEDCVGEVWIAGPHVAQGYWNKPELTRQTFQAELADGRSDSRHYLRTGDLGFLHRGQLFITGRIKEVIILAGRNLYPQDIELSIVKSDAELSTARCAAFSVSEDNTDRLIVVAELQRKLLRLLGYYDSQSDEQSQLRSRTQLYRRIQKSIADDHGITAHRILVLGRGELPITTSGKVKRRLCRQLYLSDAMPAYRLN